MNIFRLPGILESGQYLRIRPVFTGWPEVCRRFPFYKSLWCIQTYRSDLVIDNVFAWMFRQRV